MQWHLCGKQKLERADKWYEHSPEGVVERDEKKIHWNVNICDHLIEKRRPDMIVVDKVERKRIIIDIAVPVDSRVCDKEKEKVEKHQDLRREIKRIWNMRSVIVVPVIVIALRRITKNLHAWLEKLLLQKTKLLGTARILRKVLKGNDSRDPWL